MRRVMSVITVAIVASLSALVGACQRTPLGTPSPAGPGRGFSRAITMTGTVVRVFDNTPVAGATATIGIHSVRTDEAGRFFVRGLPTESQVVLTIAAVGYLERELPLTITASQEDLLVSLIPSGAPFDLGFYRQFMRNGFERPQQLTPTFRWTVAPRFHLRSVIDETGDPVPPEVLDGVATIFRESVPELSGGRLQVATIESGVEPREPSPGWVVVRFQLSLGDAALGRASVGGDSGRMWLLFDPDNPRLSGGVFSDCAFDVFRVAEHEITHTMGFFHTADRHRDLQSVWQSGCNGAPRSDHVRYHAAVSYSRPPGNTDIDRDRPRTLLSTAPGREGPMVSCYFDES